MGRKCYPEEFKVETVRQVTDGDHGVNQLA